MTRNSTLIRVHDIDKKVLMCQCKNLFLESNPKFKGMKLTQAFMLKKVIDYYLDL